MRIKKVLFVTIALLAIQITSAQDELESIKSTLMDYIEGTSNESPSRLKRAFHPNFNLYTVQNDSLRTLSGQQYIGYFKEGEKNSRQGRIISIDYENNAAIAKAEILIPGRAVYTDYFMLLKYEGRWKIVHKSYTSRKYPETKN